MVVADYIIQKRPLMVPQFFFLLFKKWENKVHDTRKQPVIPPGTIFKLTREMVLFGQKSSLELDHFGKLVSSLKWHQSNRKMVASNNTISRVLARFDCDSVRGVLNEVHMVIKEFLRKKDKIEFPKINNNSSKMKKFWGKGGSFII